MTYDDMTTEELVGILESSTDRDALVGAAAALARSGDAAALPRLGEFLRREEFLNRLDDRGDIHIKNRRLEQVFAVLADHPRQETAALCLTLGRDPIFLADNDRLTPLLTALTRVVPMSQESVAFLEETNREGYFAFNVPLLVRNGSPRALAMFESMIADPDVPAARRVDCLHNALVPHRTELPILESGVRLLDANLEDEVYEGVVESVFDYQTKQWYGPAIGAPEPQPWSTAGDDVLHVILGLTDTVRIDSVSEALADRIDAVRVEVRSILNQRRR